MLTVAAASAFAIDLDATDVVLSLPYGGAETVYCQLRDTTADKWWDGGLAKWVAAEPALVDNLATTAKGNGVFGATVPAAATTGLAGHYLRAKLLTTLTEEAEVLTSSVASIEVASTWYAGAGAGTTEPVSLAEAKLHLRVVASDDDDLIESLITAAREQCEAITRRALVSKTVDIYLDAFPPVIELREPPVISVDSIKYFDTSGVEQTISASDYLTDLETHPGRVTPAYGLVWPQSRTQVNAVHVTTTCGYAAPADVPVSIKQAILLLVGHWYESREAVVTSDRTTPGASTEIPFTVNALLWPYRVWGSS